MVSQGNDVILPVMCRSCGKEVEQWIDLRAPVGARCTDCVLTEYRQESNIVKERQ